jgi:AcrR family transcriptional regulator
VAASPPSPPAATSSGVDQTTRSRLLDAAAEVFCERGYERTTVAEVARRAGLTTGAIYANFRDKAELLLQTIERDSAAVVTDLEAARHAGASATDRLLMMGQRLVANSDLTDRMLFVEMFAAARRDPSVGRRVAEVLVAMESEMTRMLDRAKTEGDVGAAWDARVLARFCLALGVGFTHLAVAGLPDPEEGEWSALIRRLLDSVRPQHGQAGPP